MEEIDITTHSSGETYDLGRKLGKNLEPGQIVLLTGELGAGKTVLVQGLAEALGVSSGVTSPTYNLINEYNGNLPIYHLDLYRLDREDDLYDLGFEDYLNREGIIVIEWPQIAENFLPSEVLEVKIKVGSAGERKIKITARGLEEKKIVKGLSDYVSHGD